MDFDKTKDYEREVAPILIKLEDACEKARIPYFYCVCKKAEGDAREYAKNALSPSVLGIADSGNEIDQHMAVSAGFPVSFEKEEEFDMTELSAFFEEED